MPSKHRLAAIAAVVAVTWSCGDEMTTPPAPQPTTLELSQTVVTLDAIGATQQLSATVKDQNGQTMSGETVTWSSAAAGVATVNSSSGLVTAIGNGQTDVTASSGSLSATASVTVAQAATQLLLVSGNQQTGQVGQPLPDPMVVEARDRLGNSVPGGAGGALANTTVNFEVTTGGGSVSPASGQIDGNGQASTVWTLGGLAGSQAIQVTLLGGQIPATLTASASGTGVAAQVDTVVIEAGDAQSASAGSVLPDSLVLRLADPFGNAVTGLAVTFAVTTGGGSVSPSSTSTDANGGTATQWTLGVTEGPQQVTATVDTFTIVFNATATPAPANVAIFAGDNQSATVGTAVGTAPAVVVTDVSTNPVPGVEVVFAVSSGAGSITGDTATTDASGVAALAGWTLGTTAGTNELTASVTGSTPVTFTATATADLANALAIADGDNQTGLVGFAVNVDPAVMVQDQFGNGVEGETVVFSVASGGGSVTGGTVASDSTGVARPERWQLGGTVGGNQLMAASGALTPVTFMATADTSKFQIEVRYLTTPTATQQAAFDSAAALWTRLIFRDLSDVTITTTAGQCADSAPALNELVDDLLILVTLELIDGPGGILGSAGPCLVRTSNTLPALGAMRFDTSDLSNLEASGQLEAVIVHEMGHVLGFGSLWPALGFLQNPSLPSNSGADTHFDGAYAITAFDEIGGTNYTGGEKVPVENAQGGPGTQDGHWREAVFNNELMTGFINAGSNPLSVVSIASMWDLGYDVVLDGSDTYTQTFMLRAGLVGVKLRMLNDIRRGPIYVIDSSGRVVNVLQR